MCLLCDDESNDVISSFPGVAVQMGEDGGGVGGARRAQERENLRHIIQQWNANRLDLFEISEPNESKDTTHIPLLESPARECVQDIVIMDESTIPLHHDASQPH
ncbi:hypothetical protein Pcinc_019527 [Petrolisthes cinctipes]|uniref:Uncharacterized protein n=1 Tax=Petrolisthes cinctipes TaxID=88211 RepID=A0AAE1KKA5_PETCI|nr:hypothetical protein Pcinc_019527 [Petrolisthes cinctipes]